MASPRTNVNPDRKHALGDTFAGRPGYLEYFGLNEEPFGATADPRFLFLSASHREALASLLYGIESGRGFMSLIADPGLGKTTLISEVLEQTRKDTESVFLFQTQCSRVELLRYLLLDSGVEPQSGGTVALFAQFQELLLKSERRGKNFLLVIDEAQNLSDEVLETIRLLSNFERAQGKLVQILLAGQSQLGEALSKPEHEQLRQRMAVVTRLKPLESDEVEQYVQHRLMVAGRQLPPLFTSEAIGRIAVKSKGIPRIINNYCFSLLSLASLARQKTITSDFVERAAREIEFGLISDDTLATRSTVRPESNSYSERAAVTAFGTSRAMPRMVSSSKRPAARSELTVPPAPVVVDFTPQRRPAHAAKAATFFNGNRTVGIAAMVTACVGLCIAALWVGLQKREAPQESTRPGSVSSQPNESSPAKTDSAAIAADGSHPSEPKTRKSGSSSHRPLEVVNGRRPGQEIDSTPTVEAPQVIASSAMPTLGPSVVTPPKRFEPEAAATPPKVIPATLIHRVEPRYPKQIPIEGVVQVTATVNERGDVEQVRADSGPAALAQAAIAAVSMWRYAPATINGAPVRSTTQVTVRFRRNSP